MSDQEDTRLALVLGGCAVFLLALISIGAILVLIISALYHGTWTYAGWAFLVYVGTILIFFIYSTINVFVESGSFKGLISGMIVFSAIALAPLYLAASIFLIHRSWIFVIVLIPIGVLLLYLTKINDRKDIISPVFPGMVACCIVGNLLLVGMVLYWERGLFVLSLVFATGVFVSGIGLLCLVAGSSQDKAADKTGYVCKGCGARYKLGIDSVATTLDDTMKDLSGRSGTTFGTVPSCVIPDLIGYVAGGHTSIPVPRVIKEAKNKGEYRTWRCDKCNHVQEYPWCAKVAEQEEETSDVTASGPAGSATNESQGINKSIKFKCRCGKRIVAKPEHAGRRTKCPACGLLQTIPLGNQPFEGDTLPPTFVGPEFGQ